MPIIINGGSRSAGGWWARHLGDTKKNARIELVELVGFSAGTMPDAFREMAGLARGTRCTNHFYQANINPRADETLTPAQWRAAVETLERNLGLVGQPRLVVQHEKGGRTHRHVVWSRIDAGRQVAIPDSLTAAIHERTSRELEITFDLERGRSVLIANRTSTRPERRPKKHETFRAGETGIDPETVKAMLRALWQRTDNGRNFKAALEASGDYVLARGDRRDFVVIDRVGDDHSLARRLGVKAAEMRARMADLDPASLPSVPEAKARHRAAQPDMQDAPVPEVHPAQLRQVEPETRRTPFNESEGRVPAIVVSLQLMQAARLTWDHQTAMPGLTVGQGGMGSVTSWQTARVPSLSDQLPDFIPYAGIPAQPERQSESRPIPGGAIKRVFREAVKAVTRRAENALPEPCRRRSGETGRAFGMAKAIMRRAVRIPSEAYATVTASLMDTLDWLNHWHSHDDAIGMDHQDDNSYSYSGQLFPHL